MTGSSRGRRLGEGAIGDLISKMFSGIGDASRHTIENHADDILSAESAGVINNKKS